jgi:hypothetical protein
VIKGNVDNHRRNDIIYTSSYGDFIGLCLFFVTIIPLLLVWDPDRIPGKNGILIDFQLSICSRGHCTVGHQRHHLPIPLNRFAHWGYRFLLSSPHEDVLHGLLQSNHRNLTILEFSMLIAIILSCFHFIKYSL